jgi:hypothetical protein
MGGGMRSRLDALNSRVLTAILLVALPVLLIGAALVLSIGQSRLRHSERVQLGQIAEYTAGAIDAYVYRSILDAALLGRVPDVRRVAAAGNSQPHDAARVADLDREWQKDGPAVAARTGLLASPASQFLADLVRNDSVYREVLVTDRYGRLVAASNITSDYYQGDEAWWRNAFDNGRGRISVADVRRDESANVYAFEITVPVLNPGNDELAGLMKIVADSRELLAGIAGLELGSTSEAMLVRPDGSIVFSRRPYREGDRFFASELLHQRLEELSSRKEALSTFTYEAQADEDGTRRVIAIAPSQLSRSYPELSWLTALSMDVDELRAPFRSLVWYLALLLGLTALAVLAIALWLSLRLAAPMIDPDTDMHLVEHARVPPIDDAEAR